MSQAISTGLVDNQNVPEYNIFEDNYALLHEMPWLGTPPQANNHLDLSSSCDEDDWNDDQNIWFPRYRRQQVPKSSSPFLDVFETHSNQNQGLTCLNDVPRSPFTDNTTLGTFSNPILLDSTPTPASLKRDDVSVIAIKDTLETTPSVELPEHRQIPNSPFCSLVPSSFSFERHDGSLNYRNDARLHSPSAGDLALGTSSNPINLDDPPSPDTLPNQSGQYFPLPSASITLHQTFPEPYANHFKASVDDIRSDETILGLANNIKLMKHQNVPPPHNQTNL
jgi:hypothetical protein